MRVVLLTFLVTAFVAIECGHTFLGTNVLRTLAYHGKAKYSSKILQKRVEYLPVSLSPSYYGKLIQGILAVDLTNSEASCNVTQGGLGYNHTTLRMKSERGEKINYDVFIYV